LTTLRGGHDGADPDASNAANYDDALAGPFGYAPDVLDLKKGNHAVTPADWWDGRQQLRFLSLVMIIWHEVLSRGSRKGPS
jgi:hypothetical protein